MRTSARALDLIRSARAVVPHYAEERISAIDLEALLFTTRIAVVRLPTEAPAWLMPQMHGIRQLIVRQSGLSHAAERFLVLREVGRSLAGNRGATSAAEVFALAGIFASSEVKAQGREWVGRKVLNLKDVGEEWYEKRFRTLFQEVGHVVMGTAGDPSEAVDADFAYKVGRIAGQAADYKRAELWFQAGGRLAIQQGDWATCVECLLGTGTTHRAAGQLRKAKVAYLRGVGIAEREGLLALRGKGLHNLLAVAIAQGDRSAADAYAAKALASYGRGHPKLPDLAHDIAYFWILQGECERAYPVLRALLPHFTEPADYLLTLGSVARAAAGCADHVGFDEAWEEAEERIMRAEADPFSSARSAIAEAWVDLAVGAHWIGEAERAERAARRALEVAERGGEKRQAGRARMVLSQCGAKRDHEPRTEAPRVEPGRLADDLLAWLQDRVPA